MLTTGKPRPATHGRASRRERQFRGRFRAYTLSFTAARLQWLRAWWSCELCADCDLLLFDLWGRYVGSLGCSWTLWSSRSLVRVAGSSSRIREKQEGRREGKGSTSQGLWTQSAEYGQPGIDIVLALGMDEGGHRCRLGGTRTCKSTEARDTDRLNRRTDSIFFPAQCHSLAIQLLSSEQSRSSTLSPIHRTRFVPTPWSALHHPSFNQSGKLRAPNHQAAPARWGTSGSLVGWWGSWRLCTYASRRTHRESGGRNHGHPWCHIDDENNCPVFPPPFLPFPGHDMHCSAISRKSNR